MMDQEEKSSNNSKLRAKARKKLCKELPPVPDKLYFAIGEVARLCNLKPHVLRYWEQEFPQLKPGKRRGNRRYYQRKDILLLRMIKDLLYNRGFTIEGARAQLSNTKTSDVVVPDIQKTPPKKNISSNVEAEVSSMVNKVKDISTKNRKFLERLLLGLEEMVEQLR